MKPIGPVLTEKIHKLRKMALSPLFPKFLENQIFPGHAVFTKMSAILASNFMQNIKKIVRANFEQSWKNSEKWHFLPLFPKFRENQIFYRKSGSVSFPTLSSPNSMQKIRKNLRAVLCFFLDTYTHTHTHTLFIAI